MISSVSVLVNNVYNRILVTSDFDKSQYIDL